TSELGRDAELLHGIPDRFEHRSGEAIQGYRPEHFEASDRAGRSHSRGAGIGSRRDEKGGHMNWSALRRHCSGIRHMWLLLGILAAAIPVAAGTALIYVANRGGTTIDVIDAATNKVVHTIGNIEAPEVVRFSPDGRQLYIFSRAENFLIV